MSKQHKMANKSRIARISTAKHHNRTPPPGSVRARALEGGNTLSEQRKLDAQKVSYARRAWLHASPFAKGGMPKVVVREVNY